MLNFLNFSWKISLRRTNFSTHLSIPATFRINNLTHFKTAYHSSKYTVLKYNEFNRAYKGSSIFIWIYIF